MQVYKRKSNRLHWKSWKSDYVNEFTDRKKKAKFIIHSNLNQACLFLQEYFQPEVNIFFKKQIIFL